jgi:hypothetical protein
MNVIRVWITGLSMMAMISIGWYATLPTVLSVSRAVGVIAAADANVVSHINLVEIVEYIWGPVFVFVILLWMIIYGHKQDVQSEYAGY